MIINLMGLKNREFVIGKLVIGPTRSCSSLTVTVLRIPVRIIWNSPNNSGRNSGNGGPASLEQDLIESLAPGQFTAESTLTHGFPNKPTGKSFLLNPFLS